MTKEPKTYRDKVNMTDENINELREQIKVLQQTLSEVSHAQINGPSWYTRGENGLYQQVAMWVRRGQDAINKATEILSPNAE